MPSFLTHYACGVESYNHMKDGAVRTAISAHKTVFSTGLAGPDIFFYSIGEKIRPGATIGNTLHDKRSGAFLQKLFEETEKFHGDEKKIALAYFSGFLGHYELDASAHPLVYEMTRVPDKRRQAGRHYRYEAAMDVYICRNVLHKDISQAHQMGLLKLTEKEKKVIAAMLSDAWMCIFPDEKHTLSTLRMYLILHEYYFLNGLIIDPTGFKEWAGTGIENFLYGYPVMSPLFVGHNTYGVTVKMYEAFRRRFDRGVSRLEKVQLLEEDAVRHPGDAARRSAFYAGIGNRSYHNGRRLEME